MKYGVCVPNIDEFEDARQVADLARRAESAGWDGFFVWDHVVFPHGGQHDVADPWVLLTAVALATDRLRIGPMVTAVPRRRPGTLARQTTSLDRVSGGRLVFGAGMGFTLEAEFGTWGEPVAPPVVAQRLDEGLAVLAELWSGKTVNFQGEHFTATDVTFAPTPVQRPRPPVWLGCNWPNRRPLRRAAQWDGVAPMVFSSETGTLAPTPAVVGEIVAAIVEHRGDVHGFDVVMTGQSRQESSAEARDVVGSLAAAGATWWVEGFFPAPGEYAAAVRRIEAGPPR